MVPPILETKEILDRQTKVFIISIKHFRKDNPIDLIIISTKFGSRTNIYARASIITQNRFIRRRVLFSVQRIHYTNSNTFMVTLIMLMGTLGVPRNRTFKITRRFESLAHIHESTRDSATPPVSRRRIPCLTSCRKHSITTHIPRLCLQGIKSNIMPWFEDLPQLVLVLAEAVVVETHIQSQGQAPKSQTYILQGGTHPVLLMPQA